jgi:hypothetical protein
MRSAAALFVLIAACPTAEARTHRLVNGTSPNREFRVEVAQVDPGNITYRLVRIADAAILLETTSSYQPEEGAGDWPWDESVDAEIHWSDDNRYVVIDEQVHNYIGNVFIVAVRHDRAETIPLPKEEILARTRLHWDKFRIRVAGLRGWSSAHRLSLSLAGQVRSGTLPDGRGVYEHRTFVIELVVSDRSAIIRSCRAGTD